MWKVLDRIKGHRTWITGTIITGAITTKIIILPNEMFVASVPHLADILYALAVLIGASKVAQGVRDRLRGSVYEGFSDSTYNSEPTSRWYDRFLRGEGNEGDPTRESGVGAGGEGPTPNEGEYNDDYAAR